MNKLSEQFEKALLEIDSLEARRLVEHSAKTIKAIPFVEEVVVPVLEKIGKDWENGLIALSQVYMSSRICEELIDSILPSESPKRTSQPQMAIAILDDYHSLGKSIIYSSLRASGFELLDFGRLGIEELVQQAITHKIKILLISVLMLPSALRIKQVTERLKKEGVSIKVVVGGAPFRFDKQLWQEVGADSTGENIADALKAIHRIMEEIS